MKTMSILLLLVAILHSAMSTSLKPLKEHLLEFARENIIFVLDEEVCAAEGVEPGAHPVAARVFRFLKSTPYIKAVGYSAQEMLSAIQEFRNLQDRFPQYLQDSPSRARRQSPSSNDDSRLITEVARLFPNGILFSRCSTKKYFSDQPLAVPTGHGCCPFPSVFCLNSEYRTIDGSCNCLAKPDMGRSNRAMARLLYPQYGDGVEKPRTRSVNGRPLPSARIVSTTVFELMPGKLNNILTQMHFSVGQFIDHDSDRTPISTLMKSDGTLVNVECGTDGCQTTGAGNGECFPIKVHKNDPFFKSDCVIFVRSQAFLKDECKIGPREQANALTSWLDASQVYGSNKEELDRLRDSNTKRGKLKSTVNPTQPHCKPLLPFNENDPACRGLSGNIKCFLAGDERVNEQAGLTAMHTMFMRLHNLFEEELKKVLPSASGEKLFQEARKLLIAVWQNIIYHEYLPLTIGQDNMDKYGLTLNKPGQCFTGYDCKKHNADVTNVFATAAYRFGHSQVGENLWLSNPQYTKKKPVPFSSVMFNPRLIYNSVLPGDTSTCGVDALIHGLSSNQAETVDRFFAHQLSQHLFTDKPPGGFGTDLPALNTQRGRDHGIPVYRRWRKFCGLTEPNSIHTMEDIPASARAKIDSVYDHIDDVDLYPAAISETVVRGGTVGPTFACIIADRFKTAKFADRFWFERCDVGYTKDQIDNIKKYTLGRLMCDTLDKVVTIPRFPMMVSLKQAISKLGLSAAQVKQMFPLYKESDNARVNCSKLPGINFDLWRTGGKKKGKGKKGKNDKGNKKKKILGK